MKFGELNSSKYLAKTDLPAAGLNLTIAGFTMVHLNDGDKPAMAFLEANIKPMLVNKTNRNRLTEIFGTDDSQQMIGRRVNVYNDPNVEMGGAQVGGLRVRPLRRAEQPPPVGAIIPVRDPHNLTSDEVELIRAASPPVAAPSRQAGGLTADEIAILRKAQAQKRSTAAQMEYSPPDNFDDVPY